jgi:hypothetical protein
MDERAMMDSEWLRRWRDGERVRWVDVPEQLRIYDKTPAAYWLCAAAIPITKWINGRLVRGWRRCHSGDYAEFCSCHKGIA